MNPYQPPQIEAQVPQNQEALVRKGIRSLFAIAMIWTTAFSLLSVFLLLLPIFEHDWIVAYAPLGAMLMAALELPLVWLAVVAWRSRGRTDTDVQRRLLRGTLWATVSLSVVVVAALAFNILVLIDDVRRILH